MSKIVVRVRMEPELEEVAGHLNPGDRMLLAGKFARWARQLRVSARVLAAPPSARRSRPRRLRLVELGRN